jgi:hypothetical protein
MNRETWFVLEDDSVGDPMDVAPDAKGVLRHKDGRAVAMAPHGPRSRGVNAEAERKRQAKPKDAPARDDREVKPKPGAKYETR